ncbi:SOS response-associated peptidase family protein [Arthrobacter sp. TMT4-20]
MAREGLVPVWSRDPRACAKMINARSETITEKPSFHTASANVAGAPSAVSLIIAVGAAKQNGLSEHPASDDVHACSGSYRAYFVNANPKQGH